MLPDVGDELLHAKKSARSRKVKSICGYRFIKKKNKLKDNNQKLTTI
jgi:hypothetical protein